LIIEAPSLEELPGEMVQEVIKRFED